MEENKPIGVPSGWDEIAAWAFAVGSAWQWLIEELNEGYSPVESCSHDWHVEE